MTFELRRGDESSAEPDQLKFEALVESLEGDRLYFKMRFENPTMVSIGLVKDVVVGTILDESFFCSEGQPMTIEAGTEIKTVLPRLNPGEEFEGTMEATKSTIESSASTFMTGQLIMTLVLSVSLKQMWNLFNVMQVLAYTREFTRWPALVQSVIEYIIEALYMEKVNNAIMDFGKSKFEVAKNSAKDEFMQQQGIMDNSLMKSLGVFALSIIIILLVILVYFLIKRFNCCSKISAILNKKMFYSGPLRYVVVGYLKLFNQFATLLLIGLASSEKAYILAGYAFVVTILTVWPVWTSFFLLKNHQRLEDQKFSQQFNTLF